MEARLAKNADDAGAAMMLADAKRVHAELVGKRSFFDQVADHLRLGLQPAIAADGDVAERVQPELELLCHETLRKHEPRRGRLVRGGVCAQ